MDPYTCYLLFWIHIQPDQPFLHCTKLLLDEAKEIIETPHSSLLLIFPYSHSFEHFVLYKFTMADKRLTTSGESFCEANFYGIGDFVLDAYGHFNAYNVSTWTFCSINL